MVDCVVWHQVNYRPSAEQQAAHDSPARARLVAGGERGGKSYSSAMELVRRSLVPRGLFWIVGPTYDLARPEFQYVAEALSAAGLLHSISWPRSGPCSIKTIWGAEITTRSADDPVKLAGVAPDGVLMCEAAQQNYETYLRLRGRIAQKRGWLWMSGTFEGSYGWYADYWNLGQGDNDLDLRSFSLPTWSNRAVYPGGRDDPEIKRLEAAYPAERFMERFGAVPCPPATLVFKEFSHAKHVKSCPFDVRLPVEVWIDPGWATAYAVLAVQYHGDEVHVIDEVYVQSMTHADVIYEMKKRPWGSAVKAGVIDHAGTQHQADRSAVEVWREVAKVHLRSQPVSIEAGIDRLKTFLRDPLLKAPRILFDPRCKATVKEFSLYRYREDSEHRPASDKPLDRDNHALKAIGYGLIDHYGAVARSPLPKPHTQPGASWLTGGA